MASSYKRAVANFVAANHEVAELGQVERSELGSAVTSPCVPDSDRRSAARPRIVVVATPPRAPITKCRYVDVPLVGSLARC